MINRQGPRSYDLWGVPFDGGSTLGRPGSRYAPDRIRQALGWITQRVQDGRIYSLESDTVFDIGDDLLRDRGDAPVTGHDLAATTDACSAVVAESLRAGRVPIVLGGDDALLFPVARGVHDAVEGRVGIIHFDAHLDLLDHNPHQGKFSQSSGMRRSLELARISAADCVQVGSRHFNFPASGEFKHTHGLSHITAGEFQALGPAQAARQILDHVSGADHLFLSFDIDAIDPAYAPGSGAHEPGGLTSGEALEVVRLLAPHCTAMALTEVNPMVDLHDATTTLAAYLLFHFAVFGCRPAPRLEHH
ncbi:arginase family protein [Streptomyces sp. PT12]|uniref:arginase family protein n=1 Tax=Streptomyces sp. PT12 TaxID=1510197 RepID=UPI000DE57639|nr:arginase family protein [Streptomyces sp. PT12]RBM23017.1 arginase [Streptomyces sp. PT12]